MPLEGSMFSKFLFLCEDVGFAAVGDFNLSGKHICTMIRIYWELIASDSWMKPSCRCSRVQSQEALASENKSSFLLLNSPWWVKECKIWYVGGWQDVGVNQRPSWIFYTFPDYLLHLQPLFIHLNFSNSGTEWCHIIRTLEWKQLSIKGS